MDAVNPLTAEQLIEALADAQKIIDQARSPLANRVPALWSKLYRVGRYLEKQQSAIVHSVIDPEPEVDWQVLSAPETAVRQ